MASTRRIKEDDQLGIGRPNRTHLCDSSRESLRRKYGYAQTRSWLSLTDGWRLPQPWRTLIWQGGFLVSTLVFSTLTSQAQQPPDSPYLLEAPPPPHESFLLPQTVAPESQNPPAQRYTSPNVGLSHADPSFDQPVGQEGQPVIIPYWNAELKAPMHARPERAAQARLEDLIWEAIAHSPHVQSIMTVPQIREAEIQKARGGFDPSRFANSIWNDRSDPVGNTLTTGGASRLNENLTQNSVGVRNKNQLGGNWEAAQHLDFRDNNSLFFVPKQQADTKLLLRYSQPLMRGAGRAYNMSSICIAECDASVALHDAQQALQSHALEITQAYWRLYYNRAQMIQLKRGFERLNGIARELENRSDLDVVRNQLAKAKASVENLRSQYARATASVIQAESVLRAKVNATWLDYQNCDEIITVGDPLAVAYPVSTEALLDAALEARPDLLAIRDEIKGATVRLKVAENELKPTLNLVTDFYVRGLDSDYDYGGALGNQFSRGAPSYSGGLEYLRPKNQSIAKAIRRQRFLEMQQLLFNLNDRLLNAAAEIRSEMAEVDATFRELKALEQSTLSTKEEVEYTVERWKSNAVLDPTQVSLTLDQLVDAELRLVRAENNWSTAQADYMIAIAKLQYATGTLLAADASNELPPETPSQMQP